MRPVSLALLGFLAAYGVGLGFAADVTTVAGNGDMGSSGDGGPAIAAALNEPHGMAVAADGTVYLADSSNYVVRRIRPDGVIDTLAGTGAFGDDGDGGQATAASLSGVLSVALNPTGDILYIADIDNNRVRQLDLGSGVITSFAGVGMGGFGFDGDGGPATDAWFATPEGVAVDTAGNVYIGDIFNCVVRRVDISTGIISTVAGMPGQCVPSGDGGDALSAQFSLPRRVVLDAAGNLFVLDSGSDTVRRVDAATNVITTVAGGGNSTPGVGDATTMNIGTPSDLVLDAMNNLYISNFNQVFRVDLGTGILSTLAGTGVSGFSGDGGPAQNATFSDIGGVAIRSGVIWIADAGNHRVRAVALLASVPGDLIVELATSQAFLDSVGSVAGSILMITVDGRDLLVVPNVASVGLDVTITDDDQLLIIDLNALSSAGGNITISGNLTLQSIDMSSLATVGGSLTIAGNPALNAILISGVTSIGGDLVVVGTVANVIDMSALATVAGSLDVSDNTAATTIDMGSLTTVGGDLAVGGNTAADPIDMGSLTTVGGDLAVGGNTAADPIDMSGLTSVGGDLDLSGNTSVTAIDLSLLTTVGGNLTVSDNTAADPIDMSSLTTVGGDLDLSGNTSVTAIDLSSLTTAGGNLTVSDNTAADPIDMSGLTAVAGDLTVVGNGAATVDMSAGTDVTGNVTIETAGEGSFSMGDGTIAGDLTLDATGYADISGTTPAGFLDLTTTNLEAVMHMQIQAATFETPVSFTVSRIDPAVLPADGLDDGGDPATVEPIAAYQFTFEVPALDRDATLSFDIEVAALDAGTQTALLEALAAGTVTLVTMGDEPDSVFQAFPICSNEQVPAVDGCVRVETLDALGVPTNDAPAFVRFSNVVGHFSTWAVAIVTPESTSADAGVDEDAGGSTLEDGGRDGGGEGDRDAGGEGDRDAGGEGDRDAGGQGGVDGGVDGGAQGEHDDGGCGCRVGGVAGEGRMRGRTVELVWTCVLLLRVARRRTSRRR